MKGTFSCSLVAFLCLASLSVAQTIGADTCANSINLPAPAGGQANGNVSLSIGAFVQGSSPLEAWVPGGATVTLSASGPGALGLNVILWTSATPPSGVVTGFLPFPGGQLDLNIIDPSVVCIYDDTGIGTLLGQSCGPLGTSSLSVPLTFPTGITGMLASGQGFGLDGAAPLGVTTSARLDIGVQDLATLGAPETPPILTSAVTPVPAPANQPGWCTVAGGGPIVGATTPIYPYPRDTICPNIGPVGTNHSLYGTNFDATAPGATSATLNGIAVNISLVRPNEIIFQTTAGHANSLAGPVRVTSTGGTEAKSEDQMEIWVYITPGAVSGLPNEPANTGFGGGGLGGTSGTFPSTPGHYAFVGVKDGNNQIDYYNAEGIASGTAMRVLMAQLDGVIDQVRSQCSGLPATPAALCYTSTTQQWSQQWFANQPQCMNDTWVKDGIGDGTTLPGPANVTDVITQDDGGPGTNSFFRGTPVAPYAWTSATTVASDPDPTLTGNLLNWLVCDDFGNFYPVPAAVVPYRYLVMMVFPAL